VGETKKRSDMRDRRWEEREKKKKVAKREDSAKNQFRY